MEFLSIYPFIADKVGVCRFINMALTKKCDTKIPFWSLKCSKFTRKLLIESVVPETFTKSIALFLLKALLDEAKEKAVSIVDEVEFIILITQHILTHGSGY